MFFLSPLLHNMGPKFNIAAGVILSAYLALLVLGVFQNVSSKTASPPRKKRRWHRCFELHQYIWTNIWKAVADGYESQSQVQSSRMTLDAILSI